MEEVALESKAQAQTPEKDLRRWLAEIKLAEKREKDWRKTAGEIWDTYRGKKRRKNSFNILWANTEVLRPALYNSTPKPDVRRRFRQKDVLGKAVGEVAERSISYSIDAGELDRTIKDDVLEALLPGRGISRIRYIAGIKSTTDLEAYEGSHEQVESEQTLADHVQWDDYLQSAGKTWAEVTWVAYRHRVIRDDLIKMFGEEIGEAITLDEASDDDLLNDRSNADIKDTFKRAMLWEVWDKDSGKVFFINESYRKSCLYPVGLPDGEPPLKLKGFFPSPEPLRMVEDSGSQIPSPLFMQYKEQAEELDRISTRINKIVNACRVRFAHDPTLTELKSLMEAGDNEGIPVENARAWMANGGLEKAIWWMPIDQIAMVLKELYVARDQAKEAIYEITGLSDILRGSTNPNETLGAQKLKANSSSMRLQRMQREVQRYVRDIVRLMGEVIGEQFSVETLMKMTGLNFPTAAQKQQVELMMQGAQQQMPQGQPPPPEMQQKLQQAQQMLQMPSWEDIKAVLSNDMQREYRVDIETDSTVAESLTQDMEGLKETLTGLVELWQGAGPAVAAGAINIDVIKQISLIVCRRSRMGLEIEDVLENGFQQPKPATDPQAAEAAKQQALDQQKQQHEAQLDQANKQREDAQALHDAQLADREQQHDEALAKREQQLQEAIAAKDAELAERDQRLEEAKAQFEAQLEAARLEAEKGFEKWKIQEEIAGKVKIAQIGKDGTIEAARTKAAESGVDVEEGKPVSNAKKVDKRLNAIQSLVNEMHTHMKKPRKSKVTTPDGRVYTREDA